MIGFPCQACIAGECGACTDDTDRFRCTCGKDHPGRFDELEAIRHKYAKLGVIV